MGYVDGIIELDKEVLVMFLDVFVLHETYLDIM